MGQDVTGKGGERLKGGGPREENWRQPQTDYCSCSHPLLLWRWATTSTPPLPPLQASPYLCQRRHAEGRKEVTANWAETRTRARVGPRARALRGQRRADPPARQHALLAEAESRSVHAAFKKSGGGCLSDWEGYSTSWR